MAIIYDKVAKKNPQDKRVKWYVSVRTTKQVDDKEDVKASLIKKLPQFGILLSPVSCIYCPYKKMSRWVRCSNGFYVKIREVPLRIFMVCIYEEMLIYL